MWDVCVRKDPTYRGARDLEVLEDVLDVLEGR
jgi:hypothetical protein